MYKYLPIVGPGFVPRGFSDSQEMQTNTKSILTEMN